MVDLSDSLPFTTGLCFSPTCLELLCSKLPGKCDNSVWLSRSLVNSWKNSQKLHTSWTVDSFANCVESITVKDENRFEFLHVIGELNSDDSLKPFVNSFVSKNFLHFWPSREQELNEFKSLVQPMDEACDEMFRTGLYLLMKFKTMREHVLFFKKQLM
ncbi:hypothetical protein GEMRC1_001098 [Eukaryota sp. GEM-RC1]